MAGGDRLVNLKRPFDSVVFGPSGVRYIWYWVVKNDLGHVWARGEAVSREDAERDVANSMKHLHAVSVFGDVVRNL